MTVEKKIHDGGSYAIARVSGVVISEEIVDFQFWLINSFKSGELQKDYRLLVDARDVEIIQVEEKDIYRLSQINTVYGRQRGKLRTAIVVESAPGRKLAELHRTLSKSNGIEVDVFELRDAACNWLGIDPMAGLHDKGEKEDQQAS